ncbi:MAG: NAD/NADP octopine/nopaline dehydrogenase family protein [Burkholderiales bacterium]|nr:NAD/NADP octopine/nopaline dehydrogenase family protein [Burkholderiales bacterium]
MSKITILGCGHGGQALAGYFAYYGHSVTIYAHKNHPGAIKTIQDLKSITLTGVINGIGNIIQATTDIQIALKDAEIIFTALPVTAHEAIFKIMLPHLENNQIMINLSGHFSGVFQSEALKQYCINHNICKNILIADTTSFPFACRSDVPAIANIVAIKKSIGIAAAQKNKTNTIIQKLNSINFPTDLDKFQSIVEIGLYDPSGISHVPNTLFNAGRIGNGEEFYFYKDGITKETSILLNQMDVERCEIGNKLGLKLPSYTCVMNDYYGLNYSSIFDFFKNSPMHNKNTFCPTSLFSRYITEEVPYCLVPWYSLGVSVGYISKATKNIIDIASMIHQTNYLNIGRHLTKQILQDYHLCG